MLILSENEYSSHPSSLREVHWRVDKVEEELEKECKERKENDKLLFEKFDNMNKMIIYQLCAAILTLVAVLAVYLKG